MARNQRSSATAEADAAAGIEVVKDLPEEAAAVLDDPDPAEAEIETVPVESGPAGLIPVEKPDRVKMPRLRPSQLDSLIEDYVAEHNDGQKDLSTHLKARDVDRFKFIREHGLPNPTRAYRVTCRKGKKQTKPVDISDAVDQADAIRQTLTKLGVKQSHQWTFQVLIVEE